MLLKVMFQLGVLCLPFLAGSKCWAAVDSPVSVILGQTGSQYHLASEFVVPVDPQIAWDVLTDYDNLSKFVTSIRSHIRSEKGEDFLVHQVATGGFLFFTVSVTVLLKVDESPIYGITFRDISGKDFKSYVGSWTMRPVSQGVDVTYKLEAEKNKNTPGFVSGQVLQSTTGDLLNQIRKEMERREIKSPKANSVLTPVITFLNIHANMPANTPTAAANTPTDILRKSAL